jgi:carboxyl-terminal processing protease
LKIKREGVADLLDYNVERAVIELKSVNYYGRIDGTNIGYIRLSRFAEETGNELTDALSELQNEKKLDGLIFDLRSNGGGLLTQAVETANLFVDRDQLIVYTRGREADSERRYYSRREPLMPSGKLIILVDEGTASASEIVSGAVQDWDRGIIIGQNTYGKGLVQQIFPAGNDAGIALKLTTAKYYIPSGRCIQRPERSSKNPHRFTAADEEEGIEGEEGLEGEDGSDDKATDADTEETAEAPEDDKEIFFTNNGRPVYGGGGIVPDIEIENERWQPIEINLERQSMFFDFAVKYYASHPDIDRSFEVTDEILSEFKAYLKEREFDYKTALEISLEEMEEVVDEENKHDLFAESLDRLDDLVEREKDMDFDRSQDYIKRAIKRELMTKLYGQRGLYEEIIIKTDPIVKRALEVITNDKEYTGIIEGTSVSKKAEL